MVRFHTTRIEVHTHNSFEYLDITERIGDEIKRSQMVNGIAIVNVLHTTASLAIQESDPTVHKDASMVLEDLIPSRAPYAHSYEGQVNGAAHQRQQLLGTSCTFPFAEGKLLLGTWQHVFLIELFRPMKRQIQISILGEQK